MKIFVEITLKSGITKTISPETNQKATEDEANEVLEKLKRYFGDAFKEDLNGNFYGETEGKHTVIRMSDISAVECWFEK